MPDKEKQPKSLGEKALETGKKVGIIGIVIAVISHSVSVFRAALGLTVGVVIGEYLVNKAKGTRA